MRGLWGVAVGLVLATSVLSGEAAADEPSLGESLAGPARESFATGKLLFAAGDFAGALASYRRAYELSHDPRLVFNMAVCAQNRHDYAAARDLLRQYLAEGGTSVDAAHRAQIEETLSTIATLTSPLRLTVSPEGSTIFVDGEVIGTSPLGDTREINLGRHRLRVTKAGFQPQEQDLDVAGREPVTLSVNLTPEPRDARLVITTQDDGDITIDGTPSGRGRFDAPIIAGSHKIRVVAPKRKPHESLLEIRPKETRVVQVSLDREGLPPWVWLGGAAVLAAGATVAAVLIFKPQDERKQQPATTDSVDTPARFRFP